MDKDKFEWYLDNMTSPFYDFHTALSELIFKSEGFINQQQVEALKECEKHVEIISNILSKEKLT